MKYIIFNAYSLARQSIFAFLLVAIFGMLSVSSASADLYAHFSNYDDSNAAVVDHSEWDRILGEYVESRNGLNLFRYGQVVEQDRQSLADYVDNLTSVIVSKLNPQEQFAFWVNLYNALTIKVVLDYYPVDSIKDISFGLFDRGPWKEELVEVEGFELSLDDIEHEILRPVFGDSRIHYAVNCASIGCPNLQATAFASGRLEEMLEAAADQYINHPRGVQITDGELIVSSIFKWYARDFGEDDEEVIEHLIEYANESLASRLTGFQSIDEYRYDWMLNE